MRLDRIWTASLAIVLLCLACPVIADEAPAAEQAGPKPQQFVYVVRLVPRLHDDKAWTDNDQAIVGRHLAHIKKAYEAGQAIFVGRTMEPSDKTFGFVVFTAEDEKAAKAFMESDPSVVEGIMTAELHPFAVVFGGATKPVSAEK